MDSSPNTNSISSNRYSKHPKSRRPHLYQEACHAVYRSSEDNYRYNVFSRSGPAKLKNWDLDSLPASWQAYKEYFLPETISLANLGGLVNRQQTGGRWRRVVRHNTIEESLMRELEKINKSNQNISTRSTIHSKNKVESAATILLQHNLRQAAGSCSDQLQGLRSEFFERCAASMQPPKRSNQTAPLELHDEDSARRMSTISPFELLKLCMGSRAESIAVQGYLDSLTAQELNGIIYPFAQNVGRLITHRSGNYIATWLVLRDDIFLAACEQYCSSSLDKLVTNKCAVKVMQALAGVSKTFCKVFNQFYKANYKYLRKSKQASIIMNAVILHIDTGLLDSIEYLIDRLQSLFHEERADHHTDQLRMLSSILQVFPIEKLGALVLTLLEHIGWLAEDRIGNYSVQLLLTEKFVTFSDILAQKLCKERVYSLFSNRNKIQILFKLLQTKENSIWRDELLIRAVNLPFSTVLSLISDAAAGNLLLYLLSTSESQILIKKLEELSSMVEKNKASHKIIYSSAIDYFVVKLNKILQLRSLMDKQTTQA
jgi:recombinational DNA repair protein (RecF pathway)